MAFSSRLDMEKFRLSLILLTRKLPSAAFALVVLRMEDFMARSFDTRAGCPLAFWEGRCPRPLLCGCCSGGRRDAVHAEARSSTDKKKLLFGTVNCFTKTDIRPKHLSHRTTIVGFATVSRRAPQYRCTPFCRATCSDHRNGLSGNRPPPGAVGPRTPRDRIVSGTTGGGAFGTAAAEFCLRPAEGSAMVFGTA